MDRVLFGDNQFFGVNHMSEEKARAQAMRFQDIAAVIDVLDDAYAEGIRTFMCTTHERIAESLRSLSRQAAKYPDFKFYPCLPYAHKYANAATELGMLGPVTQFPAAGKRLGALLKGGMSLATKGRRGSMGLLIDAEMKMFAGLNTPVIFLQNVATDFLLGLGLRRGLPDIRRPRAKRYGAEPGFITMNCPDCLTRSTGWVETQSSARISTRSAFACAAA